jgi:hypothetical protein
VILKTPTAVRALMPEEEQHLRHRRVLAAPTNTVRRTLKFLKGISGDEETQKEETGGQSQVDRNRFHRVSILIPSHGVFPEGRPVCRKQINRRFSGYRYPEPFCGATTCTL